MAKDYSLSLSKGNLSFDINPSTSLPASTRRQGEAGAPLREYLLSPRISSIMLNLLYDAISP